MTQQQEFPAAWLNEVAQAVCLEFYGTVWPNTSEFRRHISERMALAALRALRDAGALAPEGWVAVPKEATPEMYAAMAIAFPTQEDREKTVYSMTRAEYRATLAAAPKPGGGHE